MTNNIKMRLNKFLKLLCTVIPVLLSVIMFFIIYTFISEIPTGENFIIIALLFCLFVLFLVLPFLILFFFFIPEKYLSIKWNIVLGLGLSFVFWILFVIVGFPVAKFESSQKEQQFLNARYMIIEDLNRYKKQYSQYPKSLKELNIKSENEAIYNYEIRNNGKDFIFTILMYPNASVVYAYCSSNFDEKCYEHSNSVLVSSKLKNNWIKTEYLDD